MNKNRLLELLIKKYSGEISPEEQIELSQIQKFENEDVKILSERMKWIFDQSIDWHESVDPDSVSRSAGKLIDKLNTRMRAMPPRNYTIGRWYRKVAVAASLIIVLGLAGFFFQKLNTSKNEESIVSTEKGFKSKLVLPDGTKVWINENTKLTYSKFYGNGQRTVNLDGEAYFDVVKDKQRPFIVHTRAMDVQVLGTAFNVRAYGSELTTEATLIRGSVEVLLKNKDGKKIMLSPNEKLVVRNKAIKQRGRGASRIAAEPEIVLSHVPFIQRDSVTLETQWIEKSISFNQEELQNIIPRLEKWYGVTMKINDPGLLNRRFTGKIETETLPEALELLKLALGLNYRMEGDSVLIY